MADRNVSVKLTADISQYQRQLAAASASTTAFGRNAAASGKEIDKLSGRLRLAADAATILGGAVPALGAAAIGGVVALSAQLGSLAGAIGVTLLATQGLGDGLKALDAFQLQPTAANAEKLRIQLDKLGPSGEHFVRFLDSLEPEVHSLQMAARDGLFPGAEEGISNLLTMLPQLRSLVSSFSTEMGSLAAEAGKALAGPEFEAFFHYLQTDGAQILGQTSRTIGNLTEAVANLFVAFGPITGDFSGGLLEFSQGLADASASLDSSQGFQEFLGYIESTGPQALATLEAVANALLQIVEATAPLGGPVLTALEGVANAIAAIADSPLGTPIFAALAALALLNRVLVITSKLSLSAFGGPAVGLMKGYASGLLTVTSAQERAQMSATQLDAANKRLNGSWAGMAKGAAGVGLLAASFSGLADQAGLANTAMLGLLGPWGAAVGVGLDLAAANKRLETTFDDLNAAMSSTDVGEMTSKLQSANTELEHLQANTILGTNYMGDFVGGIVNTIAPISNVDKFMGMFGNRTQDLKDQIGDLQDRIEGFRNGTLQAFDPIAAVAAGLGVVTDEAQQAATAIQDLTDAMREQRQEALRSVNATLDYQQAIDDARKALKDNGKTVDETTEKGRDNLRHLYGLAEGWNGLSNAAKNAKGSLETARHGFIQTATDMGMAEGKAHRLANALFEIPPKRNTQITADTKEAEARIRALKSSLDAIHDKSVNIHVTASGAGVKAAGGALTQADGGTVPGKRSPYGDKMLVMAAPGEEIISNRHGEADRFRADRASGRIPGYADGGTAFGGGTSGLPGPGGHGGDYLGIQLFTQGAYTAAKALKLLKEELDKSQKAVERERTARDDLVQQSQDFAAQVGGAYSSMDPFAMAEASSGSPWAAGSHGPNPLGSFDAALSSNIANTQAAQQALAFAAAHGLDGPLYAALAASGNLPLLQAFANLSESEITVREQQFAAQSNAQSALGGMAANAAFGQQLAAANKHLDKIENQMHELNQAVKAADKANQKGHKDNADHVTAGVNGAAASGHRRGRR